MPPSALARHVCALLRRTEGRRLVIAVAGAPGAGKSTLAARITRELGSRAVLVPMDGFHYSQRVLDQLGRADRKGAPDTFDVDGLVVLLRRLRAQRDETVLAPVFAREIEEPIAAGIMIRPEHDVVILEGNYLLLDESPWDELASFVDESWFLSVDPVVRRERLVRRHMAFGRTRAQAEDWVATVDEPNAVLVQASSTRADRLVTGT
jgi:pantothenate kinase